MSRLGRDYLQVGYYTDSYFPDMDVRFIAINDCVDSADGENELAPFRNVMNEMYARDISRKIRSAHRIRGNCGEPLSQPPYGYIKDPSNPKRWIVEPEAAGVVKNIFKWYIEGKGTDTIARMLEDRQVMNSTAYWKSMGYNRGGKKALESPYKWQHTTINKILSRQEYCGDIVNFKTYSKSFKKKNYIFALAFLTVMVFGLTEQQMFWFEYDVLFMVAFANWDNLTRSRSNRVKPSPVCQENEQSESTV